MHIYTFFKTSNQFYQHCNLLSNNFFLIILNTLVTNLYFTANSHYMYTFKKGYSIFLSTLFVTASCMVLTGCPNSNPDSKKAADSTSVKADTLKAGDSVPPPQGADSPMFKKNKLDSDTGKGVVHPH